MTNDEQTYDLGAIRQQLLAAFTAAFGFAVGCDSGDEGEDCDGTDCFSCEEQPAVTYDTFGEGFLAAYCDGCHGSEV